MCARIQMGFLLTLYDLSIHKSPFVTNNPGEVDAGLVLKMPPRILMTCTSPHSLS